MIDTKIGIIVRSGLEMWQKLNVTSFLASGIAFGYPESEGKLYEDGAGNHYLSIFKQPVLIYRATGEELQRTRLRALSREVLFALYTKDMFLTTNDEDNRASVKVVKAEDLDIVGLAIRAERKVFDKVVNGLKFHS